MAEVSKQFQTAALLKSNGVIPNFGNTDKQYWFCFVIHNDENLNKQIITYIKYPLLDDVKFIAIRESGDILENQQGRRYPFKNRDIDYRGFSFATDILPSESVTYFVGVKTDSSMSVPLMVAEEKNFYTFVSFDTLLQGYFFWDCGCNEYLQSFCLLYGSRQSIYFLCIVFAYLSNFIPVFSPRFVTRIISSELSRICVRCT